jgi:hypothetical protein
MSDPEPTIREESAPANPPAEMTGSPASGTTPAMAGATAAGGAMAGSTPAGGTAVSSASAVSARWNAFGANERLALIGAGVMLASYLIGVVIDQWNLNLASLLLVLAALVALATVSLGKSLTAPMRAAALRISAAIAAAYAVIDVGDLISELDDWGALTILLVVAAAVGAVILLVAAWRLTGGDLMRDAARLAAPAGASLPGRLVLVGGTVVLVAWVILRTANASFSETSVLAVLLTVLTLGAAWIASGGAGPVTLPAPGTLIVAGLAALVALLALYWLSNVVGSLDRADPLDLVGLVLYIGGAAALAIGAGLGLQAQRQPPAA